MGASPSTELPAALREAQQIVAEQLGRLRVLAEATRRESERLSGALRQAERQLDEVTIQHQATLQRGAPGASLLQRRIGELRDQTAVLSQAHTDAQRAQRQVEQLVRQIEMSSQALTGSSGVEADPWALALRSQVIQGREEERVRLAREVHDGPAQVLANALMVLETCYNLAQQPDAPSEKLVLMLDRLRGATREGLHEVRRFIADLRPGVVRERGLADALREYVHGYIDAYSAQVHLEVEPLPRFSTEAEIVLYRIVQESLQNAYKYARGAPIVVRLARQGDQLVLQIRDEGPGFDPREVVRRTGRSNWGLTSMRERAEMIGGRLTVASRPGHGTEVSVVLPMI
jgi:two-component system sensor histidine kinase DegS